MNLQFGNIKKILIPTDGSEYSMRAIELGLSVAKMLKAKVITIYVIDTTVIDRIAKISERENLENELRQDGSRYIKYTLALAEKERVEASSVIAKGRPYAEIIKASKDLETDLIVIGTHGRSGGERILIGSVTARVIEHSSCPILVVR